MCMPYSHTETWCFKLWISLLRNETHIKITFVLRSYESILASLSTLKNINLSTSILGKHNNGSSKFECSFLLSWKCFTFIHKSYLTHCNDYNKIKLSVISFITTNLGATKNHQYGSFLSYLSAIIMKTYGLVRACVCVCYVISFQVYMWSKNITRSYDRIVL